ncbi:MAG: Mur ligase family protein [Evtepia gabavorous]
MKGTISAQVPWVLPPGRPGDRAPWRWTLAVIPAYPGHRPDRPDWSGRGNYFSHLRQQNGFPGGLFAAFRGEKTDGTQVYPGGAGPGAAAVLCAQPPDRPGPWLLTSDPRGAFGQMAANWFGRPGERMTLVGVTGTNGKTTTTYLLKGVLEAVCQTKVGLIGTNQNLIGQQALPAQRTTPDAYTLQSLLARMEEAGCTHVVMEVSSHALALRRTAGLWFQAGIFTNLTRDHLDFHGTMEAYRKAKGLLFQQCQTGIFNLDDGAGRQFAQTAPCQAVTFGETQGQAQVLAREIRLYP